jgi:hypothetical protein
MKRFAATLFSIDVIVQLLALQHGFAVLTDGAAYRIAPDAAFVDAKTGKPAPTPSPGALVRLTFDDAGTIRTVASGLPPSPPPSDTRPIASFAVLPPATGTPEPGEPPPALRDRRTMVTFIVRVPATTQSRDTVYLTDSEQRWNPVAIRMDRIDLLRYRTTIAVPAGAEFRYLYTRGNGQTIELGRNGMQRNVRTLAIDSLTPRTVNDVVERWGDEAGNTLLPQPNVSPTPFNPAPYPNPPLVTPSHVEGQRATSG